MFGGGGGVIVCANCYDQTTGIASDVLTAANWVTQLAHMVTTIENVITVWQMLSGLTNVNAMAAILNSSAYFNAMNSFGNVPLMIQGGGFGSLGGLGGSYLNSNTYFMPTVGSPMPMLNQTANLFALRGNSLASIQAIAATSLVTANTILTGLMALQKLIDVQPSNQFMAGLAGRLHSFQGNIQSQQWQLQQMQTFAAAQERVFEEQQRQANFCSAVTWSQHTASLSGVGLTIGGTGPCLSNGITSANPVVAVAATVGGAASLIGGAAGLMVASVAVAPATPARLTWEISRTFRRPRSRLLGDPAAPVEQATVVFPRLPALRSTLVSRVPRLRPRPRPTIAARRLPEPTARYQSRTQAVLRPLMVVTVAGSPMTTRRHSIRHKPQAPSRRPPANMTAPR